MVTLKKSHPHAKVQTTLYSTVNCTTWLCRPLLISFTYLWFWLPVVRLWWGCVFREWMRVEAQSHLNILCLFTIFLVKDWVMSGWNFLLFFFFNLSSQGYILSAFWKILMHFLKIVNWLAIFHSSWISTPWTEQPFSSVTFGQSSSWFECVTAHALWESSASSPTPSPASTSASALLQQWYTSGNSTDTPIYGNLLVVLCNLGSPTFFKLQKLG